MGSSASPWSKLGIEVLNAVQNSNGSEKDQLISAWQQMDSPSPFTELAVQTIAFAVEDTDSKSIGPLLDLGFGLAQETEVDDHWLAHTRVLSRIYQTFRPFPPAYQVKAAELASIIGDLAHDEFKWEEVDQWYSYAEECLRDRVGRENSVDANHLMSQALQQLASVRSRNGDHEAALAFAQRDLDLVKLFPNEGRFSLDLAEQNLAYFQRRVKANH